MDTNTSYGNILKDKIKDASNYIVEEMIKTGTDVLSQYLCDKIKTLPEHFDTISAKIDEWIHSPKVRQEMATQISERLYSEGLMPIAYNGLPDKSLIHNLNQDGYNDGLYIGMIIALMAMIDNEVPTETILAVKKDIFPKLLGNIYEDRDKFINQFNSEQYSSIN